MVSESDNGDIYSSNQHHTSHVTILFHCPYLLISIDHELYNPLDSFIFRAHILASPHRCDGMGQRSWLIRVCKKAIPDCSFPFLFSILFELWARRRAKCHYVCLRVSSCRVKYVQSDKDRSCAACKSGYLPRLGCASSRSTNLNVCLRGSGMQRKEKTGSSMIWSGADSDWEVV